MLYSEIKTDQWIKNQVEDLKLHFSEEKLYKTPVLENPEIQNTKLYEFCKYLPKAANLHVHSGAMCTARQLFNFLKYRKDVMIDTDENHRGYLELTANKPSDSYMYLYNALVKKVYTKDELINAWSLKGRPSDIDIWDWFQILFDKLACLNGISKLCEDYFEFCYKQYIKYNIFHVEQKIMLTGTYEEAKAKVYSMINAYKRIRKTNKFFTVRLISVAMKNKKFSMEFNQNLINNTIKLSKELKTTENKNEIDNLIIGIDLVNEEDSSRSIKDFQEMLQNAKSKNSNLEFYLHAGETINTSNNEIEYAIKLNSKRIGHAYNLGNKKSLKQKIINKNICLESCPISNLYLGYCKDLRNHPAKYWASENIPYVLASDDDTFQEHTSLADDFFAAIVAWELNLSQIKQLCLNSIIYCGLNNYNKQILYSAWTEKWNTYISNHIESQTLIIGSDKNFI